MENKITSPAIKGLMIGMVLIVFAIIITLFELEGNKLMGIIPIGIMIAGTIWACHNFGQQMEGNVTFGQVFGHGFKATALVAGLMGFWVLISLTLIFPESLDRAMELQRTELAKNGMSESDIDKGMVLGKKIAVPMGTIMSVIIYLIIGAIGSLVGAAIAKKNPAPTPFQ